MTEDCNHDMGIQCIRVEEGWKWACRGCGDVIAIWSDAVFECIIGDDYHEVVVGEGFAFNIVTKEQEILTE